MEYRYPDHSTDIFIQHYTQKKEKRNIVMMKLLLWSLCTLSPKCPLACVAIPAIVSCSHLRRNRAPFAAEKQLLKCNIEREGKEEK